jgi:hypothetical protein
MYVHRDMAVRDNGVVTEFVMKNANSLIRCETVFTIFPLIYPNHSLLRCSYKLL